MKCLKDFNLEAEVNTKFACPGNPLSKFKFFPKICPLFPNICPLFPKICPLFPKKMSSFSLKMSSANKNVQCESSRTFSFVFCKLFR